MTETVTAVELSADDLRALRTADTVSFHYYDGRGYIQLTINDSANDARILSATEQRAFPQGVDMSAARRRIIDVSTDMHGYGSDGWSSWNASTEPRAAGFAMVSSAQYSEVWRTLASILRKGDRLTLQWVADNNTDNIRSANLHSDHLKLSVQRGETRLTFNLMTSVCPDNSARMIRRHGV